MNRAYSWYNRLPETIRIMVQCIVFVGISYAFSGSNLIPEGLGRAIGAALGIFYLDFIKSLKKRNQALVERIQEYSTASYYMHPALGVLYTYGWLQVAVNLVQGLLSFSAGRTLKLAIDETEKINPYLGSILKAKAIAIIQASTGEATFLVVLILIVPISIHLAHRLKKLAILWISTGMLLSIMSSLLISFSLNGSVHVLRGKHLITYLFAYSLWVFSASIGCWRARVTQEKFVLVNVYEQLPGQARNLLTELAVDELIGTSQNHK